MIMCVVDRSVCQSAQQAEKLTAIASTAHHLPSCPPSHIWTKSNSNALPMPYNCAPFGGQQLLSKSKDLGVAIYSSYAKSSSVQSQ